MYRNFLNVLIVEDRLQRVNWIRESINNYSTNWNRLSLYGYDTMWTRLRTVIIGDYYIEI